MDIYLRLGLGTRGSNMSMSVLTKTEGGDRVVLYHELNIKKVPGLNGFTRVG